VTLKQSGDYVQLGLTGYSLLIYLYHQDGENFLRSAYCNDPNGGFSSPNPAASGLFKISRTGSTITTSFDTGGGFDTFGTFTDVDTSDVKIAIEFQTGTDGSMQASVDSLTFEGQSVIGTDDGGGGGGGGGTSEVSGSWAGPLLFAIAGAGAEGTIQGGVITFDLTQNGDSVSGTTIDDENETGTVSGSISGDILTLNWLVDDTHQDCNVFDVELIFTITETSLVLDDASGQFCDTENGSVTVEGKVEGQQSELVFGADGGTDTDTNIENEIGITFIKYSDGEGGFLYGSDFYAAKEGATTCKLTLPMGDVSCGLFDGELYASLRDYSYEQIAPETEGIWTLIIDEGLNTETTVILELPGVMESAWSLVPTIVSPLDGASDVSSSDSMFWSTDNEPSVDNTDEIEVSLNGPNGEEEEAFLSFQNTTWTPPSALSVGSWFFELEYAKDIRDVPDGITISGDPWVLENSDWISLISFTSSRFTVISAVDTIPPEGPVPEATKVRSITGAATDAGFSAGAYSDSGEPTYSNSFVADDFITIVGEIFPDSSDVGTNGELVVVLLSFIDGNQQWSFLNTDGNFESWDLKLSNLGSARIAEPLESMHAITIFEGNLQAGAHRMAVGYQADGGPLIYTPKAINIVVSE
jgi:hypothetical protein